MEAETSKGRRALSAKQRCSKCRDPFKAGDAVVHRGRTNLCMPCAMKSGSNSGVVTVYPRG